MNSTLFLLTGVLPLLAVTAMATSSNQVQLVKPRSGVVRTQAHQIEALQKAVRGSLSDAKGWELVKVEVLAWALKTDELDTPPRLFEETVVMALWTQPGGTRFGTLHYFCRNPSSTASADREWCPSLMAPPLINVRQFSQVPDDKATAQFFFETNFGYNELLPDKRVLTVYFYRDSPLIAEKLREGITPSEKERRYAAYLRLIAE